MLASLRVVGDGVPAATPTATDVLDVAGVLSATTLVLAGLTALLEFLLLAVAAGFHILLACLLLFFCLQLIVCLLLLFSLRKFVSVPGCS